MRRNIDMLEIFYCHHANWHKLRNMIKKGCKYPLTDLPNKSTRISDIKHQIKRGNHPSTIDKQEVVLKNYEKEVQYAFMIPILTNYLTKIPNCNVIPIGNAIQPTLDPVGNIIQKNRTIHDCSFPSLSGTSLHT